MSSMGGTALSPAVKVPLSMQIEDNVTNTGVADTPDWALRSDRNASASESAVVSCLAVTGEGVLTYLALGGQSGKFADREVWIDGVKLYENLNTGYPSVGGVVFCPFGGATDGIHIPFKSSFEIKTRNLEVTTETHETHYCYWLTA